MNKYELVYVIDVSLDDEARKAVVDRFNGMIEQNGGKVTKVEEWGKRRLAYPINYKTEGYYLLVNFESEATLPREIERNMQIADAILRYLIVKVEEKRSNVKPRPVRVAPAAEEPAAEEAVAEEAAAEEPAVEEAPAAVEAEAPEAPAEAE
ncbi:MAG: 30S ribosomal protein S6 [Clostridia bacterium]|nr:30S ribosomal protein S6 [Clostridia bacterium]